MLLKEILFNLNSKRNFIRPSMQIWQFPFYNGTLENFVWSSLISMFSSLKLFIFFCGFPAKVTGAKFVYKKLWSDSQK